MNNESRVFILILPQKLRSLTRGGHFEKGPNALPHNLDQIVWKNTDVDQFGCFFQTSSQRSIFEYLRAFDRILGLFVKGKWLLYPRYIHDCFKKKMWLDEHDYELPNYNFAARHHRMARVNRAGAGLYKNIRVYIKLAQKSHTRAFRRYGICV
ncbi:unnamed protein product, partial [Meganyctiphanes norvegica]